MIIREIKIEDAEKFGHLTQQVERDAAYMLWEAGERSVSKEQQDKMIQGIQDQQNSTIFVAEEADELIGFLMAIGGNANRNKHGVYLVIGLLQAYRGQGLGTKLFEALEEWAKVNQIHRLELTVVTENNAGLSLYNKMGFEIEGTKKDSILINGKFVDEYYMAKLL